MSTELTRIAMDLAASLAVTACDSQEHDPPFDGDFSTLVQDEAMLGGTWILRQACGELRCNNHSQQESPKTAVFSPDDTVQFYYEGKLTVNRTYRLVDKAFSNHRYGLTSGLEIYEGAPLEFGVDESALYISGAYMDGPSEWYERWREN